MKENMTLNEQIEILEKTAPPVWFLTLSFAIPLILILVGLIVEDMIMLFFVGLALCSFFFSVKSNHTNSLKAIKALKKGKIKEGKVAIAITTFDDSLTYYAKVHIKENLYWDYNFHNFKWTPKEGCFNAKLYFLKEYPYPFLIVLEDGFFYPIGEVKKSTSKNKLGPLKLEVIEC